MRRVVTTLIPLTLVMLPAHATAADQGPERSGTIVSGDGSMAGSEHGGCEQAPECRSWLMSDCDPDLAGRDPAVMASIVDIAELADGTSQWLYEFTGEDDAWLQEGTVVQLWRQDCTEIARWSSTDCDEDQSGHLCSSKVFRFLEFAVWMTVSRPPDTGPVSWSLTAVPQGTPSPAPSQSPSPEGSPTAEPEVVARSIDLMLRRHLSVAGSIVTHDSHCRSPVPVVIQRKRSRGWVEVRSVTTDPEGRFSVRVSDRPARYRALAPEVASSEKRCLQATSPVVRHQH